MKMFRLNKILCWVLLVSFIISTCSVCTYAEEDKYVTGSTIGTGEVEVEDFTMWSGYDDFAINIPEDLTGALSGKTPQVFDFNYYVVALYTEYVDNNKREYLVTFKKNIIDTGVEVSNHFAYIDSMKFTTDLGSFGRYSKSLSSLVETTSTNAYKFIPMFRYGVENDKFRGTTLYRDGATSSYFYKCNISVDKYGYIHIENDSSYSRTQITNMMITRSWRAVPSPFSGYVGTVSSKTISYVPATSNVSTSGKTLEEWVSAYYSASAEEYGNIDNLTKKTGALSRDISLEQFENYTSNVGVDVPNGSGIPNNIKYVANKYDYKYIRLGAWRTYKDYLDANGHSKIDSNSLESSYKTSYNGANTPYYSVLGVNRQYFGQEGATSTQIKFSEISLNPNDFIIVKGMSVKFDDAYNHVASEADYGKSLDGIKITSAMNGTTPTFTFAHGTIVIEFEPKEDGLYNSATGKFNKGFVVDSVKSTGAGGAVSELAYFNSADKIKELYSDAYYLQSIDNGIYKSVTFEDGRYPVLKATNTQSIVEAYHVGCYWAVTLEVNRDYKDNIEENTRVLKSISDYGTASYTTFKSSTISVERSVMVDGNDVYGVVPEPFAMRSDGKTTEGVWCIGNDYVLFDKDVILAGNISVPSDVDYSGVRFIRIYHTAVNGGYKINNDTGDISVIDIGKYIYSIDETEDDIHYTKTMNKLKEFDAFDGSQNLDGSKKITVSHDARSSQLDITLDSGLESSEDEPNSVYNVDILIPDVECYVGNVAKRGVEIVMRIKVYSVPSTDGAVTVTFNIEE